MSLRELKDPGGVVSGEDMLLVSPVRSLETQVDAFLLDSHDVVRDVHHTGRDTLHHTVQTLLGVRIEREMIPPVPERETLEAEDVLRDATLHETVVYLIL